MLSVAAVLVMPAAVLLAGPLFFGVPHVVAELRVLAQRVPISRLALSVILAPLVLLILLRLGAEFGLDRPAAADVVLGCAAMLLATAARAGDPATRAGRMLIGVGISAFALYDTRLTTLLLAHLHNLVAIVLLVAWSGSIRRVRTAAALLAGTAMAIALLCIAATPTDAPQFVTDLRESLAPDLPVGLGHRLVLVYAFAQLLHYVIWLVWMPQINAGDTRRKPRTSDGFVAAMVVAAVGMPMLAVIGNPIALREQYLALSSFHGWLELVVLAYCGLRFDAD